MTRPGSPLPRPLLSQCQPPRVFSSFSFMGQNRSKFNGLFPYPLPLHLATPMSTVLSPAPSFPGSLPRGHGTHTLLRPIAWSCSWVMRSHLLESEGALEGQLSSVTLSAREGWGQRAHTDDGKLLLWPRIWQHP